MNKFAKIRRPALESQSLVIGGEVFRFARPDGFCGEDLIALLFPDMREVARLGKHAAAVNGRTKPYPDQAVLDARTIVAAYVGDDERDVADITQVLLFWDEATGLFLQLAGIASQALGLRGVSQVHSGQQAWAAVFALANGGLAEAPIDALKAIRTAASMALADYGEASPDAPAHDAADEDSAMESLRGKSEEEALSGA
jgi:hypothetical protein